MYEDSVINIADLIVDNGELDRLIKGVEDLDTKFSDLTKNVKISASALAEALRSMSSDTEANRNKINEAGSAARSLYDAELKLERVSTDVGKAITYLNAASSEHQRVLRKNATDVEYLSGHLNGLGKAMGDAGLSVESVKKGMSSLSGAIQTAKGSIDGFNPSLNGLADASRKLEAAQIRLSSVQSDMAAATANLNAKTAEATRLLKLKADAEAREQGTVDGLNASLKYHNALLNAKVSANKTDEASTGKLITTIAAERNQLASLEAEERRLLALEEAWVLTRKKDSLTLEELARYQQALATVVRTSTEAQIEELKVSDRKIDVYKELGAATNALSKSYSMMAVGGKDIDNARIGFSGLSFQVSQLVREVPTLTMSSKMFFLAISNNLPIFVDELARARLEAEGLKKAGKEAVPVWRQVVAGLISWQTAAVVGVSMLIQYNSQIKQFFKELVYGKNALDDIYETMEKVNEEVGSDKSGDLGKKIALYEKLRMEWLSLGETGEDLSEWIKRHKKDWDALDVSVTSVADADSIFINNSQAFVDALTRRSIAMATQTLAAEKYGEAVKAISEKNTLMEKKGAALRMGDKVSVFREASGAFRAAAIREAGMYETKTARGTYGDIIIEVNDKYTREQKNEAVNKKLKTWLDSGIISKSDYDLLTTPGSSIAKNRAWSNVDRIQALQNEYQREIEEQDKKYNAAVANARQTILLGDAITSDTEKRLVELGIKPKQGSGMTDDEYVRTAEMAAEEAERAAKEAERAAEASEKESAKKAEREAKRALSEAKKAAKGSQDERVLSALERAKAAAEDAERSAKGLSKTKGKDVTSVRDRIRDKSVSVKEKFDKSETDIMPDDTQDETIEKMKAKIEDDVNKELDALDKTGRELDQILAGYADRLTDGDVQVIKESKDLIERTKSNLKIKLDKQTKDAEKKYAEKQREKDKKAVKKELDEFETWQKVARLEWDPKGLRTSTDTALFDARQGKELAQFKLDNSKKLGLTEAEVAELKVRLGKYESTIKKNSGFSGFMSNVADLGLFGGSLSRLKVTGDNGETLPMFSEESIKALTSAKDKILSAIGEILSAETKLREQEVKDAEERTKSAEDSYKAEIEARRAGYASDVEAAQKELDLARKNEQDKKKMLADSQRAQIAIDTATQASSMATATAQLIKSYSGTGPAAIALITAAIAAMWGTFAAAKVKAAQVARQTSKYGKGGYEMVQGGSHVLGNDVDLGVTTARNTDMVVEGGEAVAVINRRAVNRYSDILPDLIRSVNEGSLQTSYATGLAGAVNVMSAVGPDVDLSRVELGIDELRRQGRNRCYNLPDGRMVFENGNVRRIVSR